MYIILSRIFQNGADIWKYQELLNKLNMMIRLQNLKVRSGVNFMNIFRARFSYERLFLVTFKLEKEVRTKNAHEKRWWNWPQFWLTFFFLTLPTMTREIFDPVRPSTWMTCTFWIWSCFKIARSKAPTLLHSKILFELSKKCRTFFRTIFREETLKWLLHFQSSHT